MSMMNIVDWLEVVYTIFALAIAIGFVLAAFGWPW